LIVLGLAFGPFKVDQQVLGYLIFIFIIGPESHCVVQASLELMILLPQPPECSVVVGINHHTWQVLGFKKKKKNKHSYNRPVFQP
jgi:hypothetical protein